jgi:hypothetical protein
MMVTERLHKWLAKRAVGRQLQLIKWFVEFETLDVAEQTKKTKAKHENQECERREYSIDAGLAGEYGEVESVACS